MKRIGIYIVIILISLFVAYQVTNFGYKYYDSIQYESYQKSLPLTLLIPKLNINAHIEYVGVDNQRRMDVPKDPNNVGWFKLGTIPGKIGNAVIDGHLDTKTSTAVFYHLSNLNTGDEVRIQTNGGEELIFNVVDKKTYNDADFPSAKIFGKTNQKNLILITCAGVFDKTNKLYSQRLVVYTKLEE